MLRKPAVSVYVVVLCLGIHLENVYNLYFKVLYFPHDFDCEYLEYLLSLNCYVTNALLSLSLSLSVTLRVSLSVAHLHLIKVHMVITQLSYRP